MKVIWIICSLCCLGCSYAFGGLRTSPKLMAVQGPIYVDAESLQAVLTPELTQRSLGNEVQGFVLGQATQEYSVGRPELNQRSLGNEVQGFVLGQATQEYSVGRPEVEVTIETRPTPLGYSLDTLKVSPDVPAYLRQQMFPENNNNGLPTALRQNFPTWGPVDTALDPILPLQQTIPRSAEAHNRQLILLPPTTDQATWTPPPNLFPPRVNMPKHQPMFFNQKLDGVNQNAHAMSMLSPYPEPASVNHYEAYQSPVAASRYMQRPRGMALALNPLEKLQIVAMADENEQQIQDEGPQASAAVLKDENSLNDAADAMRANKGYAQQK